MTISSTRFRQILREEAKRNLSHTRKPLYESIRGRSFLIIENLSSSDLTEKMKSKEGKEEVKASLWEKFRDNDAVDIGLDILALGAGDIAGLLAIPSGGAAEVVAMIPDLLNAVRKFSRGDKFGGAISLICAIPIAGDLFANFVAAEKLSFKGVDATVTTVRTISAFFKEHGDAARKINTSTAAIMKVVKNNLPADLKDHAGDITNTISAVTSGDKEKLMQVAKDSGAKIVKREISKNVSASFKSDKESDSDNSGITGKENDLAAESRTRSRNRKLRIIMGR